MGQEKHTFLIYYKIRVCLFKKLARVFCEAVQFKRINLVGRIMKKILFLKKKEKLNFCVLLSS